jgi:putative thioredoxin
MDEIEKIRAKKLRALEQSAQKQTSQSQTQVVVEVRDSNFDEEVIHRSQETPVVVDFWSSMCLPCLKLGPTLEKLAQEFGGKFVLAKVNVDQNPMSSQLHGVSAIPTVKMFVNGRVATQFVGLYPETSLRQWLEKNIEAASQEV